MLNPDQTSPPDDDTGYKGSLLDRFLLEAEPGSGVFQAFAKFAALHAGDVTVNQLWGIPDPRSLRNMFDVEADDVIEMLDIPDPVYVAIELGWLRMRLQDAILMCRHLGVPLARLYNDGMHSHFVCSLAAALRRPI